jgi:hypothetical protein
MVSFRGATLTAAPRRAFSSENRTRTCPAVDHRSFRDQLAFSVGFAVSRSRDLLRRLIKEHAPDDARQMLAERVMDTWSCRASRSTKPTRRLGSGRR